MLSTPSRVSQCIISTRYSMLHRAVNIRPTTTSLFGARNIHYLHRASNVVGVGRPLTWHYVKIGKNGSGVRGFSTSSFLHRHNGGSVSNGNDANDSSKNGNDSSKNGNASSKNGNDSGKNGEKDSSNATGSSEESGDVHSDKQESRRISPSNASSSTQSWPSNTTSKPHRVRTFTIDLPQHLDNPHQNQMLSSFISFYDFHPSTSLSLFSTDPSSSSSSSSSSSLGSGSESGHRRNQRIVDVNCQDAQLIGQGINTRMPQSSVPASALDILKSIEIFNGLDAKALEALAENMEQVTYQGGEVILTEGQREGFLFAIVEGNAEVTKTTRTLAVAQEEGANNKHPVRLITMGKGDLMGVGSLVDNQPHSATVVACAPECTVIRLNSAKFLKLVESHPSIPQVLLRHAVRELRTFRSKLVDTGLSPVAGRQKVVFFDFKTYEKEWFESEFKKAGEKFDVYYYEEKLNSHTVNLAAGAQIVCIFVNDKADADVLTKLSQMGVKMIALRCAGFNNVDLQVASALKISVARVPAYSPYAVAEHAVAMLMSLNRHIPMANSRSKTGNFSLRGLVGFDVHGKKAGVIGTGKIGQCFIKIMLGFGCEVLAYDAFPSQEVATWPGVKYVDLPTLYKESDLISIHCPLLPSTHHLINESAIAQMKQGVAIVNTSRGGVINTKDLINGLKTGKIGMCGLDVIEEESEYFFEDRSGEIIGDESIARLLTFNNVLITSHQAFLTREALLSIARTSVGNMLEFVGGKRMEELTNTVNKI